MKNKEKNMENQVIKALCDRRSIRGFKDEQIKDEQLKEILKAGTYAPTGRGKQSPIIVVVQDKETIAKISRKNAEIMGTQNDPFYGAPTVLIVLSNKNVTTHFEDGCLVMGNLMNAAYAVGVDSCWIHRAREEFEEEFGKELLSKWGIEGDYVGIGHVALGYRAGEYPVPAQRKPDYIYYAK